MRCLRGPPASRLTGLLAPRLTRLFASVGARDEIGGHWVESAMDDQPRDVSEQPDPAWASTEGALVRCDPGLAVSGGAVLVTGLAGRRPVLVCC